MHKVTSKEPTGGADYPWMTDVGRWLADVMPNGQHRDLEGQEHVVPPEVLAPVLAEFFTDSDDEQDRADLRQSFGHRPIDVVLLFTGLTVMNR